MHDLALIRIDQDLSQSGYDDTMCLPLPSAFAPGRTTIQFSVRVRESGGGSGTLPIRIRYYLLASSSELGTHLSL
jgi:hypothetical protein